MEIHYICSMDYKRIYDNLMESRLLLKEDRIKLKKQGEYFEAHHIIPKSMGGEGNNGVHRHPNIVILTAREHYIAHALLWLIHRNREMATAFSFMCNAKKNKKINIKSSRMYEEVRCYLSSVGRSPETRQKISKGHLGKKKSPEHVEKIRKIHSGKKLSPESIAKREETKKNKRLLGWIVSDETRQKISKLHSGRKKSPEHKEKLKQANMGRKKRPEEIEKIRQGILLYQKSHPEWKEKLRQANIGRKKSPEEIAKHKESRKRNRLLKLAQMEGNDGQGK